MSTRKWEARTKQTLIVEVWEGLDCESVGQREIELIQREVATVFGAGAVDSPAAVARVLADEGAVLRHPEVLDFDTAWREELLSKTGDLVKSDLSNLRAAHTVLLQIDAQRKDYLRDGEEWQLLLLRELVVEQKQHAQLRSRSRIVDANERQVAMEVVQWMTIWLQDPDLFEDWLGLRVLTPEFLEKFGSDFEG